MAMHTITALFHDRNEADRVASAIRSDAGLSALNVRVLPEGPAGKQSTGAGEGGFLDSLRNFFMPEEDRHGYAEGMRRGDYMVAVDAEAEHASQVIDLLERHGAIDMDAEEAKWRTEGWRGYETSDSTATTAGAASATAIPAAPAATGTATNGTTASASTAATHATGTSLGRDATMAAGTEERIPLVEERLKVGKRQVIEGRVRIRSYVVETPVTETVMLHDEHIDVVRRTVDRPLTGNEADLFREREIEATEMHEEPVVSKEARVREELVMHKSADDHEETVRDTVRHTEVKEDRGTDPDMPAGGTARNPGVTSKP